MLQFLQPWDPAEALPLVAWLALSGACHLVVAVLPGVLCE